MGERGEKEGGAGGGSAGNRVLFFTVAKSILGIFRRIMEGTTTRRASKMDFNGTQQRRDVKSLLPSIISPNTREPPVTLSLQATTRWLPPILFVIVIIFGCHVTVRRRLNAMPIGGPIERQVGRDPSSAHLSKDIHGIVSF